MTDQGIDSAKLKTVIENCLKEVPKTEWKRLPEVLLEKGRTRFFVLATRNSLS